MGRSIRSKIGKRLRTAKRQRADAMVYTPKIAEQNQNLQAVIEGRAVTLKRPKNGFKYPEDDGAIFPQHEVVKPIDYRSGNLPMAQYAFRGNRRKYTGEELDYMKNLSKTSHPKMEVLAGGGAIHAKTGKKMSMKEAEILATAVVDPQAAALAMSGPSNSTSAIAAAVQEDEMTVAPPRALRLEKGGMTLPTTWTPPASSSSTAPAADVDMDEDGEVPNPVNAVDHSRLPVMKDNRRVQRTAIAKRRANSTQKTKAPPKVGPGSAKKGKKA